MAARGCAPLGCRIERRVSSCPRRSTTASHETIALTDRRTNSSPTALATKERFDAGSSELSLGRDSPPTGSGRKAYLRARRRIGRCTCTDLVQAGLVVRRARSELPDPAGDAQALEALHRLGGSISQRVQGLGS